MWAHVPDRERVFSHQYSHADFNLVNFLFKYTGEWSVNFHNSTMKRAEYTCCPGVKFPSFIGYMKLTRKPNFFHLIYTIPAVVITLSIFL